MTTQPTDMRYTVAQWSPEYGVPTEPELEDASDRVDAGIELPVGQWREIMPDVDPADDVLFIDGVRRVDANLWIEQPGGRPALGLAATYAAGAVRSNGTAQVVEARVERGLFTSAAGAADLVTTCGTYSVRATSGGTPEELWLGIQQRMGELEGVVAVAPSGAALIIADGPLSHHRHAEGAVGYVKREHVEYLPVDLWEVKYGLAVGRRTPLFVTTTSWSRYSWYVRLANGAGPAEGLVRCEVSADTDIGAAVRVADRVTATLPRFASAPHKDPRAPENLYPIAGLERELRRRLGDQQLMYRALRVAAWRAA
ncbi:MAG TPA: hypothetical protein VHL52_02650 [Acidimicrobiia bacterium]|nr:hypothetical protein [Acidimicrobiia bacterium]